MDTAEIAIIFIMGSLILVAFVFFLALIIIEYRKRQVRHITEKLELEHRYQNEVLQTQLEVQEQSFKYVSEELHDNIAQTLSLSRLKLYKIEGKVTDEVQKNSISSVNEILGTTLQGLRGLSHVLNGGLILKLTLKESIEKELNYLHDVNDMDGHLTITGLPYEPEPEKKLLIFRIVQESINNAIKHGKANEINISLAYDSGVFTVQIADNGKGFDTRLIQDSKGLGLHNIHVRAKMLGKLDIQSAEGQGTTITLNIKTDE